MHYPTKLSFFNFGSLILFDYFLSWYTQILCYSGICRYTSYIWILNLRDTFNTFVKLNHFDTLHWRVLVVYNGTLNFHVNNLLKWYTKLQYFTFIRKIHSWGKNIINYLDTLVHFSTTRLSRYTNRTCLYYPALMHLYSTFITRCRYTLFTCEIYLHDALKTFGFYVL